MLHTGNEPPLLEQMELLQHMSFLNTAPAIATVSSSPIYSLLVLNSGRFLPRLDGVPDPLRTTTYDEWWNEVVIQDAHERAATRGQLVKWRANKEEVHVAAVVSGVYEALSHPESQSIEVVFPDKSALRVPIPIVATIRQITHELLRTLALHAPAVFEAPDDLERYSRGALDPVQVFDLRGVSLSDFRGSPGTGFFVMNEDGSVTIGGSDPESQRALRRLAETGGLPPHEGGDA